MMAMRQRKMKRRWAQRVLPARAEMASWAAAKRPPLETTGAMAMSGVAGWMIWWRPRRIQASSKPKVSRKIPARDMSAAQTSAAPMRGGRMCSARVKGESWVDIGLIKLQRHRRGGEQLCGSVFRCSNVNHCHVELAKHLAWKFDARSFASSG